MGQAVLISWSSGKDSAWTLYRLRAERRVRVVGLLTTLNASARRVSMHAVRERLLQEQARRLDLPLWKVWLPYPCSNADYERLLGRTLLRAKAAGVDAVAFGDLFLEDVREYRERLMAQIGLRPLFPLWGQQTAALAEEMVRAGLRAWITCVDPQQLDPTFLGRVYDAGFLAQLPPAVDPCGERGEFHTFVHQAPIFSEPIPVRPGRRVERDGFLFADLVLRVSAESR